MAKKTLLILFTVLQFNLYSLNYITTAESVSWSGAYTSVADGFEAMLYNPAGLYMTERRFGLNFFGSYGARFYNNIFSSDHALKIIQKIQSDDNNITPIIQERLNSMMDLGMDFGADLSLLNFMTYIRYKDYTIGFSMIPKTSFTSVINKKLFDSLFNNLNLIDPLSIKVNLTMIQYLDFSFNLSTRAKMLEKAFKVQAVYAGFTAHAYIPSFYLNSNNTIEMLTTDSDPLTGLFTYTLSTRSKTSVAGFINQILRLTPVAGMTGNLFMNDGMVGFGVGADLGFIIKFNKFFRFGMAINDLGFIVLPVVGELDFQLDQDIGVSNLGELANFQGKIMQELGNTQPTTSAKAWMPPTGIRGGIAIEPVQHPLFNILIAADLSVTDFNRLINSEYPTFNFAAGIEITRTIKWLELLFRTAFSFNTQASVASFSFGLGAYFGPIELEIGVKGLEALISGWGAKEVAAGIDLKLEF